jgi:hypothetical protein
MFVLFNEQKNCCLKTDLRIGLRVFVTAQVSQIVATQVANN